eukprot:115478_1
MYSRNVSQRITNPQIADGQGNYYDYDALAQNSSNEQGPNTILIEENEEILTPSTMNFNSSDQSTVGSLRQKYAAAKGQKINESTFIGSSGTDKDDSNFISKDKLGSLSQLEDDIKE